MAAFSAPSNGKAHFTQVVLDLLCETPDLLMVVSDLSQAIQSKFGSKEPCNLYRKVVFFFAFDVSFILVLDP